MWLTVAKYTIYTVYSPVVVYMGVALLGALGEATHSVMEKGSQQLEEFQKWAGTCNCRVCVQRRSLGQNTFH